MENFKKDTSLASEINRYLLYVVGALLVVGIVYVKFMLGNAVETSDKKLVETLQSEMLMAEDGKKM